MQGVCSNGEPLICKVFVVLERRGVLIQGACSNGEALLCKVFVVMGSR